MRIYVLGMGGVGGIVGGALAAKYDDVHFIARGKTLEAIKEKGLRVESDMLGTFTCHPASVSDMPTGEPADILIVCTKSYGLASGLKSAEGIIGENTVIVPLLNGIGIDEDIRKITDKGIVAEGAIFTFSSIKEPGVIQHRTMLKIQAGMADGSSCEKLKRLMEMLGAIGFESEYSDCILKLLWEKYIMMCGNSCVYCYFDEPSGEMSSDPVKMKYAENIFNELVELAALSGVQVSEGMAQHCYETFKELPAGTMSSLYRDISNGNPDSEFDSVIGKAGRISRELGADTPCIDAVCEKYSKK